MLNKIKYLTIGTILGTIISTTLFSSAQINNIEAFFNDIRIKINGKLIDTGNDKPFIFNGKTYVPARYVAEELGATVKWNESSNAIEIESAKINSNSESKSVRKSVYNENITTTTDTLPMFSTNANLPTIQAGNIPKKVINQKKELLRISFIEGMLTRKFLKSYPKIVFVIFKPEKEINNINEPYKMGLANHVVYTLIKNVDLIEPFSPSDIIFNKSKGDCVTWSYYEEQLVPKANKLFLEYVSTLK